MPGVVTCLRAINLFCCLVHMTSLHRAFGALTCLFWNFDGQKPQRSSRQSLMQTRCSNRLDSPWSMRSVSKSSASHSALAAAILKRKPSHCHISPFHSCSQTWIGGFSVLRSSLAAKSCRKYYECHCWRRRLKTCSSSSRELWYRLSAIASHTQAASCTVDFNLRGSSPA